MNNTPTQSAPVVALRPIRLPRLTFIVSNDADANYALAQELQNRDDALEISYIRWPLMDASASLLSTYVGLNTSPDTPTVLGPLGDVISKFEASLVADYGDDVLGRLLVQYISENNTLDDRIVIIDANLRQLPPVLKEFGADNLCVVMLEAPTPVSVSAELEAILLPTLSADEAILALERTFGVEK